MGPLALYMYLCYVAPIIWFLLISDPPESTSLNTSANVSATIKNSSVTFMCTAEGNPAPHEYRFYHDNTYLGKSSSGNFQTKVTEGGLYFCVPFNKAGEGRKASVHINIAGELD